MRTPFSFFVAGLPAVHSDDVVIYKTVQEKWGVRSDIVILAVDGETLELAICLFAKKLFFK